VSLETRAAVEALKAALGPEWETAVTVETSKSAITTAARVVKARTGESMRAIEARTYEALRAAGAIKTSTSVRVEERAVKAADAAQ